MHCARNHEKTFFESNSGDISLIVIIFTVTMLKVTTHPKSSKAPAKKPAKGAVDACLGYITRELEVIKASNGGKVPYMVL